MDFTTAAVTLKAAASVAHSAGKIPLQAQLLDMQQDLLSLVAKQADLLAERAECVARIAELETLLRLRDGFHHERNAYWKRDGEHVDGPFCSTCFDADGKAIRLIEKYEGHGHCGVSKNQVILSKPHPVPSMPQRRVISPGFTRAREL